MERTALVVALVALTWGISAEAIAKGRLGASHTSPHTSAHPAADSHLGEGAAGIVRNTLNRAGRSDGNGTTDAPAEDEQDLSQRRIRQERNAAREADRIKAEAEALAARQADQEKRRQQAEQAAVAAAAEQKRQDAETRARNKQLAALDQQQRQAAWEARCQIKPVMSDAEIDTCREVWSKPAP